MNEAEAPIDPQDDEGESRAWRPSRRPAHNVGAGDPGSAGHIVERVPQRGALQTVRSVFGRPLVKIFIGLSLIIVGAIVFEAAMGGSGWSEREAPQKAAKHPGVRRPRARPPAD